MIITFAWTTPPLLAGAKSVTRRDWQPQYADRFHAGDVVEAWDKRPAWGGRRVALIRLTDEVLLQSPRAMPDSDYEAEGFAWLDAHPEYKVAKWRGVDLQRFFRAWQRIAHEEMYTVRFTVERFFVSLDELYPQSLQQGLSL